MQSVDGSAATYRPEGLVVGVTGASGFVGSALIAALSHHAKIIAFSRSPPRQDGGGVVWRRSPVPEDAREWLSALRGVDVLIHLAAIAHIKATANEELRKSIVTVNARWPAALAGHCAAAGVKKFVFLSSIKALGERSIEPLDVDSVPHPEDAYGRAKGAAEIEVQRVCSAGRMDFAIVRCPLVYGRNARANFGLLVKAVDLGLPIPLGGVGSRRSIVALDNLVDSLRHIALSDRPRTGVYHIADRQSYRVQDIVRLIAAARGHEPRLITVRPELLRTTLRLLGQESLARKLLDSLELATEGSFQRLQWRPPIATEEAMMSAFRDRRGK